MAARRTRHGTSAPRASGRRASAQRVIAKAEGGFPVVAIGASAGGLEAFRTLITALPPTSGMAFILVQHLAPTHASMMVELLSPYTTMTVVQARSDARLEPDHVYVIPPGGYLTIRDGALHLSHPEADDAVRMPFDVLLRSLATELGERAVCIVLSGTAADGSAGAIAVKAAGGLVIVQDPDEAGYDGMPRSAIATGAVDLVLPLAKIPEAVAKHAGRRDASGETGDVPGPRLTKIIDLLRARTTHDFALYKEGTLARRIERRMAMAGIEDDSRYLELLTRDPAELQHLVDDFLINVTRFFRDAEAFALLAETIVPELVQAQPANRPIRIWVAGCSTGEEAYSVAMLFHEAIAAAGKTVGLQVFASDVDADAVALARQGLYPPSIETDVAPARLGRFFTKEDHGYRVSRALRATIVFSVHDLISDAPFSRLDLISCRNLLIYLRPEVQAKVLSLFHFALRQGGVLVLGASESIGGTSDNFAAISKKHRIFRHIGRSRPGDVAFPLGRSQAPQSLLLKHTPSAATARSSVRDLAQRMLLEGYAPASVLVNRKHQAVYFFGAVDLYLKMPQGVPNQDLLASAREGLRASIKTAFDKASEGEHGAVAVAGRVKRNGRFVAVRVGAQAVTSDGEDFVLLSFLDAPKQESMPDDAIGPPAGGAHVAQIEQELDATRTELAKAIVDRETAEEEIRAIHEEAMSVNEEFQTTNEELETSKEELQSLNEELTVLNTQLQETIDLHKATANDLENILNSSDVATLILDEKLNIRFFTPAAKPLVSVIASDIGRPLADLARHFADANLLIDAQIVLDTLMPLAREIQAENDLWYSCRILPYRTKDNRIEGVVITFIDITARKQAEDASKAATLVAESANLGKSRFLAAASHDLRQPLQVLTFLQGHLALMLKDDDALQLVARSEEALAAMSGMLNTLLDINQLEAGVIQPKFADVPVNDLLQRLKTEFSYHMQNHRLDWRVLPCRLTIRTDPRLLEEMIRNLLSNAAKYTNKGRVVLGCRRRGDKLRIEVWDTGLGIPAGELRAIFEEFHQIDNPARELSRGLGLGLAIVQRLGGLMNHPVDVRSREGRGSVFAIEVPRVPAAQPVPADSVAASPAEVPARTGAILIVEDDPALRSSLEDLLRADGHRTTTVADGEEAVARVANKDARPDIVIVDYDLPGQLNGIQVVARLRGLLAPDLPALILTGDISTKTLSDISRLGYRHHSKPIGAKYLRQLIRTWLTEVAARGSGEGAGP